MADVSKLVDVCLRFASGPTITSKNIRAIEPLGVLPVVGLQETIFVHEKRRLIWLTAPFDTLAVVRHIATTVIAAPPHVIVAIFATGFKGKQFPRNFQLAGSNQCSVARGILCDKRRPIRGLSPSTGRRLHSPKHASEMGSHWSTCNARRSCFERGWEAMLLTFFMGAHTGEGDHAVRRMETTRSGR
jgi:hypothetical protein